MRMKFTIFCILLFLVPVCHSSFGQVRLPQLVRDSMVLQRDTKMKIWGWASKGEKITIKFNGKTFKTTTAANGKWSVLLSPMKAGGPYAMNITASNTITLKDILIGVVFVLFGMNRPHLHSVFCSQAIKLLKN